MSKHLYGSQINRNTKCDQGWRCRSDSFQLWQQTVAAWSCCAVCTQTDDRPGQIYSWKPGTEVGQPPPDMRLKKSYCWLTVWSRSFIGLSGPRQTSRQKHRLKTRNWANPSDDWICGISQIKTEQERNSLLHKLDVDCVRLNKYRLEAGTQVKREKEMKTKKRKILQTNIPNKRRLMLNKIINKIKKQNRSELNGIKRLKWECLECLKRYIKIFYSLKRKRLWNKGSQS